jgi:hypothetical protein
VTPALTARKLGRIHRIRFVCPWSGFALLADDDELVEGAVLCSSALTDDGSGASGIAVAATSPCGVAAVNSKPAFCCAIAGVRANRKITPLVTNRIKSPVLIKSTPLILRTGQSLLCSLETGFRRSQLESLMSLVNFGSTFSSIATSENWKRVRSGRRQSTLVLSKSCVCGRTGRLEVCKL